MKTLSVEARTHGLVLVREAAASPRGLLIGFHGYAENAEIQMAQLETIPGVEDWTLVSVQGLNRFYRGRSQEVVSSWMTRQDRGAAIEDNIDYVDRVIAATRAVNAPIVFAGFSQGVAMAFRAAVRGKVPGAGVISVGADVPPELLADASLRFPPTLLTRGEKDDWYTAAKMESDAAALTARGTILQSLTYKGGHEWTAEVSAAARRFIRSLADGGAK